jgi:hypothetical protein
VAAKPDPHGSQAPAPQFFGRSRLDRLEVKCECSATGSAASTVLLDGADGPHHARSGITSCVNSMDWRCSDSAAPVPHHQYGATLLPVGRSRLTYHVNGEPEVKASAAPVWHCYWRGVQGSTDSYERSGGRKSKLDPSIRPSFSPRLQISTELTEAL